MAACCEHGHEPSGSVKCGEFLDWLTNRQLLNDCSVESVGQSESTSSTLGVSLSLFLPRGPQIVGQNIDPKTVSLAWQMLKL